MRTPGRGRERITTLSMYGLVLLLVYLVYRIVAPFLVPLAWAAVLVIFCYPWHARLPSRWKRSFAAAVSTALVTTVLIVPAVFVGSAFVREAARAADAAQRAISEARPLPSLPVLDSLQRLVPTGAAIDVKAIAGRAIEGSAGWLAARVGTVLEGTAIFVFQLVVTIFAAFFLFRDADAIMRRLRNVLPLDPLLRERLLVQIRNVVAAAVTSSFVVATVQGFLGGLAFWFLGISGAVFWGVLIALCCLIPLGAWVVWLPWTVWLVANGSFGRALILAGVGTGIVSGVDNVLRPMLISGQTRLNGLLMFISLLGGVAAFGLLGLMLGPVVMATGLALLEVYSDSVEQSRSEGRELPV